MLGIDREIKERYNLDVRGIQPYRDSYILTTSQGGKILKPCPLSPERILFVHGAKEHLAENGFNNLDRYLCTDEGKPWFEYDGARYTLTELIDGRDVTFDSREDVCRSATLLASLHVASRGYMPPEGCQVQDDLGNLPVYFGKRLAELKKLKKVAIREKGKFDHLFLENVEYFYSIGDNVLKELCSGTYDSLVEEARRERGFCHHDFTHSNLVFAGGKLYIKNFEYCCYELKVYDIANFLRRKMRKCNWALNEGKALLKEYQNIEKLGREELHILKLILRFPQKFWRVANRYYNSRRNWSERIFYNRLQEVIEEVRYHERFMDKFDSLV